MVKSIKKTLKDIENPVINKGVDASVEKVIQRVEMECQSCLKLVALLEIRKLDQVM